MQTQEETKVRKPETQELRVLKALEEARDGTLRSKHDPRNTWIENDGWVNKQHFIREMYLTQAGRAIWNLEHRMGVEIEHSDFRDEFGFRSYRLPIKDMDYMSNNCKDPDQGHEYCWDKDCNCRCHS